MVRSKIWTDESTLQVGETIVIAQSDFTNITHLAIYIGNGYYLSKFGSTGPLIVAELSAMKTGFSGTHVFRTRPISPNLGAFSRDQDLQINPTTTAN